MENENIEEITEQVIETFVTFEVSPKAAAQVAVVVLATTIVANILTLTVVGGLKVWSSRKLSEADYD